MTVNHTQLNDALIAYLGGGLEPGIIPYGQEERLRAAFPVEAEKLLVECKRVIDSLSCNENVLQTGDLVAIANYTTDKIQKQLKWLDPLVAKKLGNYYSYSMR